jgi:nicotinamidase/pyrazinamidase
MKHELISSYPALLVIDMVKDNFDESRKLPITPLARQIIEPINRLKATFRTRGWPVVFSTDAFQMEDFIFSGRMKPHSLEGTEGARVIDELGCGEADLWLPKPRFSAFFRTSLDQWLKERGVTLCAVAGIATNFCVLTTALDSICCDFRTVILEDCTAAVSERIHAQTLDLYRRSALYPLLRVVSSRDLLSEMEKGWS